MSRDRWLAVVGCLLSVAAASAVSRLLVAGVPPVTTPPDGPPVVARGSSTTAAGSPVPTSLPTVRSTVSIPGPLGPVRGVVVQPRPAGPPAGWPGLVVLAGAGPSRAESMLSWAERLAERGVAVLTFDKRVQDYSFVQRDFRALSTDAVAAAELFRTVPGIDPLRVGAAGFSEGGWIVPLMAEQDPRLATMVQLSGPNVSPNEQIAWQVHSGLAEASAPPSARAAVLRALGMPLPGGLLDFGRFRPEPSLSAARVPLLTVFGLADATVPTEDGAAAVLAARTAPTTIRLMPGLGHGLQDPDSQPAAEVVDLVAAWVTDPTTAPADVAGGPPEQRYGAVRVEVTPAWLAPALAAGTAAVLVGALGTALSGRRTRPEGGRFPVPSRPGLVALGTWLGHHLGLGGLVVTGLLGGGTIPMAVAWAVVKLSSLAAVVAVPLAARARPGISSPARAFFAGLALSGAMVFAVLSGGLTRPW